MLINIEKWNWYVFIDRKTPIFSDREIDLILDLPPKQFKEELYATHYANWIYTNTGNATFHRAMHNALEKGHANRVFPATLEIGARNLEHFNHVKHKFKSYTLTDIDNLKDELSSWKTVNQSIEFVRDDISCSKLASNSYDRVIVTCVLHHVPNVEAALIEIRRLAKSGGVIDILLPCDPGLLYRMLKYMGPYRYARKANYIKIKKLLDARDHINHFSGILELTKFTFRKDETRISIFPFKRLSYDFNLWATIRILKSNA